MSSPAPESDTTPERVKLSSWSGGEVIELAWGQESDVVYPAMLLVGVVVVAAVMAPGMLESMRAGEPFALVALLAFPACAVLFLLYWLDAWWKSIRVTEFLVMQRQLCVLEHTTTHDRSSRDAGFAIPCARLRGLGMRREDWTSVDPNGLVNEHTRRTLEAELQHGPPVALFSTTDEIAPTLDWVGTRLARRLELPYRGEL